MPCTPSKSVHLGLHNCSISLPIAPVILALASHEPLTKFDFCLLRSISFLLFLKLGMACLHVLAERLMGFASHGSVFRPAAFSPIL
jgi:hypothetical protein